MLDSERSDGVYRNEKKRTSLALRLRGRARVLRTTELGCMQDGASPISRHCTTWFKLRLIIMISRSAGGLLRAVDRYHWDTRTVEFDLSRALFLY